MYPAEFDYHRADSVADAVKILQENPEAKLLAGGHSLLPMMKLRLAQPGALVDISKISELTGVREDGGAVVVGSMTTYNDIVQNDIIKQKLPVLAEAAEQVGDIQVRNMGTIGGAIAHADPASDFPAVVLALDAEIKTVGASGEKTYAATEFFVDMFTSAIEPDEVVTEVRFNNVSDITGATYKKFEHPASGYAIVGVAAVRTSGGDVRLAVTGSVPIAVRLSAAEAEISGKDLTEENVNAASEKATDGLDFVGDIHASEEYRAHLTKVFTRRALQAVAG